MAEAGEDFISLAETLQHVVTEKRMLGSRAQWYIVEAIREGRLPTQVERTTRYLPHPPRDAPSMNPPPTIVTKGEPLPEEVLEIGVGGRGSLHIDWFNNRATRLAGVGWGRIYFEGISCSRPHVMALWPLESKPVPTGKRHPKYRQESALSEMRKLWPPNGKPPEDMTTVDVKEAVADVLARKRLWPPNGEPPEGMTTADVTKAVTDARNSNKKPKLKTPSWDVIARILKAFKSGPQSACG